MNVQVWATLSAHLEGASVTRELISYSLRHFVSVFTADGAAGTAESAYLRSVEAAMLAANNAYTSRRYQEAIDGYRTAQALIYGHLDVGVHLGVLREIDLLPRHPDLLPPLLSAAVEWANVLPVSGPRSGIQPRVTVDPELLSQTSRLSAAGLTSAQFSGPGLQAAADVTMYRTMRGLGNEAAAAFHLRRAEQTSPEVTRLLLADQLPQDVGIHSAGSVPADSGADSITEALGELVATAEAAPPPPVTLPPAATVDRNLALVLDEQDNQWVVGWQAGDAPPIDQVSEAVYARRVSMEVLTDLVSHPQVPSDFSISLPHLYFYVIPLALAECYHALQDWERAEQLYLTASSYPYLNTAIEAPYVWLRLATLYLDWGNQLYRDDDAASALPVYERVLTLDGTAPADSPLFVTASLAGPADMAWKLISVLDAVMADTSKITSLGVDPVLAALVFEVHQRLVQIGAGLDFWGHWHPTVPIWTFDYLQQVAVGFAQLAISAERDVISFWDRADQGQLTRMELSQRVAQAQAESSAAAAQVAAAAAERDAYQAGADLADTRAADAKANADEYAAVSADAIVHQALQSQLSGGDDGDSETLNAYADQMLSGSYSLTGSRGTLAASEQLTASRLNRQYEVDSMRRTQAEMEAAAAQAKAELAAADARVTAAQAANAVAELRAAQAAATVEAFDAQTFTPDVWHAMGQEMMRLYQRYLGMALKIAKLMQSAYNFETDQQLALIKAGYTADEVKGLLGADALMADIQSFTYDLVTATRGKPQPVKQTISLAERYGWLFETEFRRTGSMSFETRADDFDSAYPGTYAGRIRSVEAEVVGVVPVTGLSGTLTNSGISSYRTPAALWDDPASSGLKHRVQPRETLVLSDFSARSDNLTAPPDQRMGGIFAGAGVLSSWRLDIPREVNDIDFGALLDVRLTFTYDARFDPDLASRVLSGLRGLPGVAERQRGIPLRWLYPDLFFRFRETGTLQLTLAAADFRTNETAPTLTSVGVVVGTSAPASPGGITVSLATPATPAAALKATTDTQGSASSATTGSPWTPLATGSALGTYQLGVDAGDNPALVRDGRLDLSGITNLALVLGYSFTPRG
ncbi:Tc toxin subunit A-related protein [Streptomyces sp. NPDC002671]